MSRQTPDHYQKLSFSVTNSNQFQALSEFPTLPYSQIVKSNAPNTPTRTSIQSKPNTSKVYFTKPKTQHLQNFLQLLISKH